MVKLTTVNKVLLGRQPKLLNPFGHQFFFSFKLARFDFSCFNFDVFVLQYSEVPRLLRQRRNSMESFVQTLGKSKAESRKFSPLENFL